MEKKRTKVVTIGGGTGSFVLLRGLRDREVDLTAIVNMVDDGGSTGVLRDELGILPPGDVRQCLVALSRSSETLRDLFNYRFEEGGLQGHSFGNLFLTALEKTTGSFAKAVETASEVLNVTGRVIPVTLDNVQLCMKRADGTLVRGQYAIENTSFNGEIPQFHLEPQPALNPEIPPLIEEADIIVIAPGNLYTSLCPTLMVQGLADALQKSRATLACVTNLVTKPGQTDGFKVHDFVREIERFIGAGRINYVIYNTHEPSRQLLEQYAREGEYPVLFDESAFAGGSARPIGADLLSRSIPQISDAAKMIPRTLIRHDSQALASIILDLPFTPGV